MLVTIYVDQYPGCEPWIQIRADAKLVELRLRLQNIENVLDVSCLWAYQVNIPAKSGPPQKRSDATVFCPDSGTTNYCRRSLEAAWALSIALGKPDSIGSWRSS